uniref:Uncharacterized protein n=1 Tax=Anopheles culicifacies TaxID=139723 RepID=A0A182M6K0_9DIPT
MPLATVSDQHRALRLAGRIARLAYLFHQLQSLHNEREDSGEAAHFPQNDAELRSNQAHVVVTLLATAHTDRATNCQYLGVVRHEETLLEHGPATASIVQLEITRNDALVFPALKDTAALVAEAELTRAQSAKVLRHLRCYVVAHLDQYAPERLAYSLYASAGDCWSSMPRNSFALVRLLRISATSNVGRWLISSVSTWVLSAVHASRILSKKSRCLNTKCCSSASDFCINSKSDAMSVRMWSRASACVFTGCCRCSSPLAQARQTAVLHFKHHSALGMACVRQFSPLLRYLPDPMALTIPEPLVPALPPAPPPTPIPIPPPTTALPITPAPFVGMPVDPFEATEEPTLLPVVTTTLIPLPTLLLLVLLPPLPPPPPTTTLIPDPEAPLPDAPPLAVDTGTTDSDPPLVVLDVVATVPQLSAPLFDLSGGFLFVDVMLPLEIMLRFWDRYRMALCVGSASGFISGPVSSVRFQQCTQYSSLPFSSTWLTHLRQK